ncbi:hypothetical protein LPTSP4_03110 [Leptospira ryugenii]|uniref:Uncharacterized protein n=1 Tax=Leptospira ryugenii TaxID=1917863 RepID=A0A2P2DVZ5_9LEPT|nr:hypothetical protein [Leptospira ryugenii]GBF48811.1 hypothetical protein LPTSP4_03110 [Leptospira ryugenii]
MRYANRILNGWRQYDRFTESLYGRYESKTIQYISFCRNLYVAFLEFKRTSEILEFGYFMILLLRSIIYHFCFNPILSDKAKVVIIEVNASQDSELAAHAGISLVRIEWKFDSAREILSKIRIFFEWILCARLLLLGNDLKKFYSFKTLPELLLGINLYNRIDLSGIEKIVTQRDRYPEEIGILKKAKELGIKTFKFDHFLALGTVNQNRIFCEYYLYPNQINASHFKKFEANKDIKYYEVGFPYWDAFAKFRWKPERNPKIITFFSQYGNSLGIFGPKGPYFYIQEILETIDDSFLLLVKPHPIELKNGFPTFKSNRIQIVDGKTVSNPELISKSCFVLSLASQALIEAKHINPQSAYINYEPEHSLDWDYSLLNGKLELIRSRKELREFLYEKKDFISCEEFIDFFHPSFPNSLEKITKAIHSI